MGIRLRRVQIRPGLPQLLVYFRRINIGKQFALIYAAADVAIPLSQVPVGARINRGLHIRLQRSWQHQIFIAGLQARVNDRHRRDGGGFRFIRKRLVLHAPLEQQNAAHHDQQGHDQKENREERAPFPRRPTAATACHAFSCHSIAPNSNS